MMKELTNKIEKDMLKVWYIHSYITLAVLLIIFFGYMILMFRFDWWRWPLFAIGICTVPLFIYERFVSPHFKYKTFRYELGEDELEIQSGVFIVSRTLIPMNRVQYVTTEQGPIMKKYQLTGLEVSTAATKHSITGITESRAEELRRFIAELVKESEEDV